MSQTASSPASSPQLLYLVFGGELKNLDGYEFRDPTSIDVVGIFADYQSGYAAWKNAAQRTVDDAMMRYFLLPLHQLLERNAAKPE